MHDVQRWRHCSCVTVSVVHTRTGECLSLCGTCRAAGPPPHQAKGQYLHCTYKQDECIKKVIVKSVNQKSKPSTEQASWAAMCVFCFVFKVIWHHIKILKMSTIRNKASITHHLVSWGAAHQPQCCLCSVHQCCDKTSWGKADGCKDTINVSQFCAKTYLRLQGMNHVHIAKLTKNTSVYVQHGTWAYKSPTKVNKSKPSPQENSKKLKLVSHHHKQE